MTRTDYLGSLGTLALGLVVFWLLLRPLAGERWFDVYGSAAVALAAAVIGGVLLTRRYRSIGRSPWRALWFSAPLALLATLQIAYWTTVFTLGADAVGLLLVRTVVRDAVGPWLPALSLTFVAGLAWLLFSAARPTSHLDR